MENASQKDYDAITRSVRSFPKDVRIRLLEGEIPVVNANGHLCVNMPITELEKLYSQLNQYKAAVKKRKKK